jgi:hypothetical protein
MTNTPPPVDLTGVNPESRNRSIKRAILECVVGSTVHGTNVSDGLEDLDLLAVVIESPRAFMGFSLTDTWVERTKPDGVRSEAGDVDRSMYGLRKFLSLALKGNPTMLLPFFVPPEFVRFIDDTGRELQALYPSIVSRECIGPFRGYMKQQHERLLGLRGQRNIPRGTIREQRSAVDSRSRAYRGNGRAGRVHAEGPDAAGGDRPNDRQEHHPSLDGLPAGSRRGTAEGTIWTQSNTTLAWMKSQSYAAMRSATAGFGTMPTARSATWS